MEGREYALEVAFCSRLSMAGDLGENGGEKFRPGNSNCLRTGSHGPVEIVDLNMVIFHSYVIVDFPIKNGDFP